MIHNGPLRVIHWDYNKPGREHEQTHYEMVLVPVKIFPQEDPGKKGIAYRLRYRIKTSERSILSFIGECHFTIDKEDRIGREEIIGMAGQVYNLCREEFDLRKKDTHLKDNLLPEWDAAKFDHTASVRLLQE